MGKRKPRRLQSPQLSRDDMVRLWPVAVITLLAAFGLFCAWQAWVIGRQSGAAERVQQSRQRAQAALGAQIAALHRRVNAALSDPQLLDALSSGGVAGHAAATSRAYTLLPKAQVLQFYSESLDQVINADFQRFGYARAAQLMAAQSNDGRTDVQTVMRGSSRMLSLAQAVTRDGQTLAYAWIEFPYAPLQQTFDGIRPGSGRLELRQDSGIGDMILAANGSRAVSRSGVPAPIPGSNFAVVAALPSAFIVLPRSWPLAALLALLAWAGAVALARWRVRSMRYVPTVDEDPTLEEFTRQEAAAASREQEQQAASDAAPTAPQAAAGGTSVDRHMFRAYDIRGVVGTSLDADVARLIGQSIGSLMVDEGLSEIVVGRDGRISGPELAAALAEGLRAAGIDVIDIGAAPTPVVYFGAFHFNAGSCVAVTGSHNPPDYNGFKIVVGGQTLAEDAIQNLYVRIVENRLVQAATPGNLRLVDIGEDYIERIAGDVQAEQPLKVVVDAGNGIAGALGPQLIEAIGCEVVPLYCDVDGTFPNHHPDPSDPRNLDDLILSVKSTGADLGVAFDGDGDRLGVVTPAGEIIYPDRLLMLFARDVLSRQPGASIIYDVKCTGHLQSQVLAAGGSPVMWRTGHSLIKAKMRETGAALAGEMSGHFFFGERWYGFDDGLYAATRLLEILAGDLEGRGAEEIFATLPKGVSTPELNLVMEEGEHYAFIEQLRQQASFEGARMTIIDGLRADWPDGWGLVRASNTSPKLVLRFDADNEDALKRIQAVFREQILAVDADLKLPF